jgi:hypothetical protein
MVIPLTRVLLPVTVVRRFVATWTDAPPLAHHGHNLNGRVASARPMCRWLTAAGTLLDHCGSGAKSGDSIR